MNTEQRIKQKKPGQLKLSSMSEHWGQASPNRSDKHRSQEMQAIKKKARQANKRKQQKSKP